MWVITSRHKIVFTYFRSLKFRILLVLLAPVLYLFLKNIWTGAAFLLVLLVALFKGVALPELNLDALIYYSFAAYAALHGRKWAEAVWSCLQGEGRTLE